MLRRLLYRQRAARGIALLKEKGELHKINPDTLDISSWSVCALGQIDYKLFWDDWNIGSKLEFYGFTVPRPFVASADNRNFRIMTEEWKRLLKNEAPLCRSVVDVA